MQRFRHLLDSLRPDEYDITWQISQEKDHFSGTVCLRGELLKASEEIVLHAKDLKVTRAAVLYGEESLELDPKAIKQPNQHDELVLKAGATVPAGPVELCLSFEAPITEPMHGIYPSFFVRDGQAQRLIGTQFESHHAREAFPCIDEPAAKAVFRVTLDTAEGEAVVSNTPVAIQTSAGGRTVTTFEPSPKMSTYLLAFVAGEMKSLEATTKDGVLVRTWATPDNVAHTRFALETAVRTLEYFNEYFDVPYPLAKCDMVALPDFSAGAMENWGCITYRESALLVDEANTSLADKQYVALVVAHELAHQWFGNLVTMRWWTDLWLNEGFASWIEYLALDKLFPEWEMWDQFVSDDYLRALSLDSLEHTHPVEVTVDDPEEIRTIFDAISYSKGASVIRMLHAYLGPEPFRDGLRHYLKEHQYGNAATADLWASLEEVTGRPVRDFMSAWTSQPGFPLVEAERTESGLAVTQTRYMINPRARKRLSDDSRWPVPLNVTKPEDEFLLTTSEGVWPIKGRGSPKLNAEQTGFYLVRYPEPWLKELAANVKDLSNVDRLGLLQEAWNLARAGFSASTSVLELLDAYRDEHSLVVWEVIGGILGNLRLVMDDDQLAETMKPFTAELAAKELKRLGWDQQKSDSHADRLLRPLILGMASFGQDESVVKEALSRFDLMERPEDQPPDVRGVIYGTVVRERNDTTTYEKLWQFHKTTNSSQEKTLLSDALTSFRDPKLIDRALSTITTKDVKLQEVAHWAAYAFANRHGKRQAWEWMVSNWGWINEKLGGDLATLAYFPRFAARPFYGNEFIVEFKAFFEKASVPGIQRPIDQAIETLEWQTDWRERDLEAVKAWFASRA